MNSNSWYNDFFFPRDAMHSAVLTQYSVCLSQTVCLSVCDALQVGLPVPCSHRLDLEFFKNNFTAEQLKAYALADPNMGDLLACQQQPVDFDHDVVLLVGRSGATETPQNYTVEQRWGQEHIKAFISRKWCMIGPRLLLRTNRKQHTRFRLAPKSMTSDDLERPKRHSCRNEQNFRSLNSFRIKIRAKYSGRKREQNQGKQLIYRAHRAVIFAIVRLSCLYMPLHFSAEVLFCPQNFVQRRCV